MKRNDDRTLDDAEDSDLLDLRDKSKNKLSRKHSPERAKKRSNRSLKEEREMS